MQEAWANYTFSEAWAARRTVILKAAMGEDGYEEMLGFALWSLGAAVADIVAGSGVQRSGFYYRLSQVRMKAWEAFRDGPETNGRRVAALTPEQAWQVAEWVVSRPGISLDEIVQENQDLDQFPPGAPGNLCKVCMYWWAEGITVPLPKLAK